MLIFSELNLTSTYFSCEFTWIILFCCKGIGDPELDQDDDDEMIYQPPVQDVAVLSESEIEETDEMLFEPPPMFARYCFYQCRIIMQS